MIEEFPDSPRTASWSPRDLLKYAVAIWRFRWLLVAGAIVGGAISLWGHITAVPVFTATSRLLIERQATSLNAIDQLVEGRGATNVVDPTQLQLLESRDFILRVIAAQDELLGRGTPGPATAQPQPAAGDPADTTPWLAALWRDALLFAESLVDRLRLLVQGPPPPRLDVGILEPELVDRRLAARVGSFRASYRVTPAAGTNLVGINWTSRDPVLATKMANLIAEEFVAYTVETQAMLAEQVDDFLASEISSLREDLRQDRQEAGALAERMGIADTALGNSPAAQTVAQLNAQYATARADRMQKESALRQMEVAQPSAVPEVRNSEAVRQARATLTRLQGELEVESERLTDAHPRIATLREDVAEAQQSLADEERAAYQLAVSTATQAHRAAAGYESRIQQMLEAQQGTAERMGDSYVQYQALLARIDTKQKSLQQFLDRQASNDLRSRVQGFQGASVRVADRATLPQTPAGRRLPYKMLIAGALGVLVGALVAIGLDLLDSTLRTSADVLRRLGSEPLGTTLSLQAGTRAGRRRYGGYGKYGPATAWLADGRAEFVASEQPRSTLAEDYRELRTNLLLSMAGTVPRRVLVTSTDPGEGKTSVSCNLAISLAQAGKKVLLVDCDLRRPRLAQLFNLEKTVGLSNFLAGACNWQDVVKETSIENLWVLPSGPIPPNPAELYSGTRDEEMFEQALERFDMLVVDSPPVMHVVDSLILAREVDAILLVVRAGTTPHQTVARTRTRLAEVGGRVLGIVLTNVDPVRARGSYYHARRYYESAPGTDSAQPGRS